jgi:hypothetical protein
MIHPSGIRGKVDCSLGPRGRRPKPQMIEREALIVWSWTHQGTLLPCFHGTGGVGHDHESDEVSLDEVERIVI